MSNAGVPLHPSRGCRCPLIMCRTGAKHHSADAAMLPVEPDA